MTNRNNNCSNNSDRKALLRKIQVYGFALYDTALFLDSHPDDNGALDYYDKMSAAYNQAKMQYEDTFGPLMITNVDTDNGWSWTAFPWPWEYEAN